MVKVATKVNLFTQLMLHKACCAFSFAKTVYFPLHCTRSLVIALSCNYTQLETDFTGTVLKCDLGALGYVALALMKGIQTESLHAFVIYFMICIRLLKINAWQTGPIT